jgi:hypothetical protein
LKTPPASRERVKKGEAKGAVFEKGEVRGDVLRMEKSERL